MKKTIIISIIILIALCVFTSCDKNDVTANRIEKIFSRKAIVSYEKEAAVSFFSSSPTEYDFTKFKTPKNIYMAASQSFYANGIYHRVDGASTGIYFFLDSEKRRITFCIPYRDTFNYIYTYEIKNIKKKTLELHLETGSGATPKILVEKID